MKPLPAFDPVADGKISVAEWCAYAKSRTTQLSDLSGPYVPAGKRSYTPKVLPSLTFLDHKDLVFAPAPSANATAGGR